MPLERRYWLMKTEPDVFSIDDLQRDGVTSWDGVRNYQARNFMRDKMQLDDEVLFYHSNAKPPGVAGIARVSRTAHPDKTAQDPKHPAHDPRATPDQPIWMMVEVAFAEKFPRLVTLDQIKQTAGLEDMWVCRRGMRCSVQPVQRKEFEQVLAMGRRGG